LVLKRRRRAAAAGAIVVLAAVVIWWLLGRGGDGDSAAKAPAAGPGTPMGSTDDRLAKLAALAATDDEIPLPATAGPEPERPIIDRIELEKDSVCEGEENLVTVVAHTVADRDNAYLHATIAGESGMSVPVRRYRGRDGKLREPREIIVFGRNNAATAAQIPEYEVRDCMVDRKLVLSFRLQPNTNDVFDVTARIVDLAANQPFEPVSFHWDFGDGTTETTHKPAASHDYGKRPQTTLYTNMLLSVTAESETGERVTGRRSLALMNHAYGNLVDGGIVTIMVDLSPRFPVIDDNGRVEQGAWLWHHRPGPVKIDSVKERRNFINDRPAEMRILSARKLLGTDTIPRGGIGAKVSLDTIGVPDLFSIDYLVEGVSAEGVPARGMFSVMRPSPKPTKENSTPVLDPELEAKIKKAREVLDQEIVTDEDLWELERDGVFDDLVIPDGPRRVPTYADLPPGPSRADTPAPDTPLAPGKKLPVFGDEGGPTKLGGGKK
jgi:hypothetical protein